MKKVLLSADNEISVYSVPDAVADDLVKYCMEFHSKWLWESPDAAKYHVTIRGSSGVCFDEKDFIDYLNKYICKEQSTLISTLNGIFNEKELPEEYAGLPYYNF